MLARGFFINVQILSSTESPNLTTNTTVYVLQMPPKKKQAGGPVEVAPAPSALKPPAQKNASTLLYTLELH